MAAKGRPVSASRSRKVAAKLQEKIQEGNYYEAHQTYRALYQRYSAQGREKDARDLLYDGASLLLQHCQWESGTDLALLMVTHMKERRIPITEDVLDKIGRLFSLYNAPTSHSPTSHSSTPYSSTLHSPIPHHSTPDSSTPHSSTPHSSTPKEAMINPRETFMRAAIKWSSMVGGEKCKFGHPRLHELSAVAYWQEKYYGIARDHFLYSEQSEKYGAMLVEFATTQGYPREADLFITQAVLQLLVLKNHPYAFGMFSVYTTLHPAFREERPPFQDAPLLNFLWFVLLAVDRCRGDSEVFHCLRENYTEAICRDPYYNEYLDKIGKAYFGMPEQPRSGSNLLDLLGGSLGGGGLLGSLLGGPPPEFLDMAPPPSQASADVNDSRTLQQKLSPMDTVD